VCFCANLLWFDLGEKIKAEYPQKMWPEEEGVAEEENQR
jgi:hypothetical protein